MQPKALLSLASVCPSSSMGRASLSSCSFSPSPLQFSRGASSLFASSLLCVPASSASATRSRFSSVPAAAAGVCAPGSQSSRAAFAFFCSSLLFLNRSASLPLRCTDRALSARLPSLLPPSAGLADTLRLSGVTTPPASAGGEAQPGFCYSRSLHSAAVPPSAALSSRSANAERNAMATHMNGFDPLDPAQVADVMLVPTLSDNYAYLLVDRETKEAACVDPAEPQKVLAAAKKAGVDLKMCLCTHKHLDHSGGNEELAQRHPEIQVVGSGYERTPGVQKMVRDGDVFSLGSLRIRVLHAPCHTGGHVLYFVTSSKHPEGKAPILFTGDTLFVGGCGRFFEGTAQQMCHALLDVIRSLPKATRVYCGHEYTKSNLEFALKVEPSNKDLQEKYAWTVEQRKANKPTVPSSVEQEMRYNPFMRVEEKAVQEAMHAVGDKVETMQRLRDLKNRS
ncbi:hydroxyacylglutathione hydrolase [Toxoplasma gondii VAND]|uniref:hydroxyacylglutathione hydrolase n=1 Tax=Toxoplasma gondii VAND TaxID=933077 RepID=A0A086PIN7_TOXGO|nr:hydroxyacylglutathione hydrolase [Toxoplasma gondii VAND]